ncbi:hypothetical protein B296_00041375 [Ensete ventricosum]|uniref:Uncharacterized protein n=1 Tax=Ensete ventricosum TaxID=4639 RepID=A0A426YGH2_ENSVE|nr:hypothetical protein B296_00041375 [Ensete ventricosum]
MRLNRIELFYALFVAIDSESRCFLRGRGGHMHAVCMQRWLATTSPPVGATDHGLATCKGRPARKGLLPAASPIASRGGGSGRRGGHPLAGRLSAAKGSHRLCRGSGGGDAVRVKES